MTSPAENAACPAKCIPGSQKTSEKRRSGYNADIFCSPTIGGDQGVAKVITVSSSRCSLSASSTSHLIPQFLLRHQHQASSAVMGDARRNVERLYSSNPARSSSENVSGYGMTFENTLSSDHSAAIRPWSGPLTVKRFMHQLGMSHTPFPFQVVVIVLVQVMLLVGQVLKA